MTNMTDEQIIALVESELSEKIVTTMDSTGQRTKKKDAKTRQRQANQNSSLSRAERKKLARKAAKTKKRDVKGQRIAKKKTKKAMKKRKQAGLDKKGD